MMTPLEEEVKTAINNIYCAEYTGTLKVTELKDSGMVIGYKVRLGLNKDERPLYIAFEGNKPDFFKYLEQELRIRRLADTYFYEGEKLYKEHVECCK